MTDNTDRFHGLVGGAAIKVPCVAATTAAITLSAPQTIDGVSVVANDRVLVKNQSNAEDNGIYIVKTTDWERAKDFNGKRDVVKGTMVRVTGGSTYANRNFELTTTDPDIETTSIDFSIVAISNAAATPIADAGGYFTGTEVETALQEAGADIQALEAEDASDVAIVDAGGYYDATDVEAALQEVQSDLIAKTTSDYDDYSKFLVHASDIVNRTALEGTGSIAHNAIAGIRYGNAKIEATTGNTAYYKLNAGSCMAPYGAIVSSGNDFEDYSIIECTIDFYGYTVVTSGAFHVGLRIAYLDGTWKDWDMQIQWSGSGTLYGEIEEDTVQLESTSLTGAPYVNSSVNRARIRLTPGSKVEWWINEELMHTSTTTANFPTTTSQFLLANAELYFRADASAAASTVNCEVHTAGVKVKEV